MVEFNPDGSIKLPGKLAKRKEDDDKKMHDSRCIRVRKEIVSTYPPKSCALFLTLSDKITDSGFIEEIYADSSRKCEVQTKLVKLSDKEFKIEIGTCFRRCSDCASIIRTYKEFLDHNVIEVQGGCTFKQNVNSRFCEEDYFS